MAPMVKNLPANAGNVRDVGSIPGWRRSPGEGNGNSFLYSWLENPTDRGAWWATVIGPRSRTRLKPLSMHARRHLIDSSSLSLPNFKDIKTTTTIIKQCWIDTKISPLLVKKEASWKGRLV